MLCEFHASGYRSLRAIRFPISRLGVFVGANGVGKSNLYRALQVLQAAAAGTLSHEIAAEGGMQSVLWAGDRDPRKPVRLKLAAGFASRPSIPPEYVYEIALGLIPSGEGFRTLGAAFALEAQVKEEALSFRHRGRTQKLLERRGPVVTARDDKGVRTELGAELMA
jgi:predicted ATPase